MDAATQLGKQLTGTIPAKEALTHAMTNPKAFAGTVTLVSREQEVVQAQITQALQSLFSMSQSTTSPTLCFQVDQKSTNHKVLRQSLLVRLWFHCISRHRRTDSSVQGSDTHFLYVVGIVIVVITRY